MSGFPDRVENAVRLPPYGSTSAQTAGCVVWLSALKSRIARGWPSFSATQYLRRG
jgi:hypothetical protein